MKELVFILIWWAWVELLDYIGGIQIAIVQTEYPLLQFNIFDEAISKGVQYRFEYSLSRNETDEDLKPHLKFETVELWNIVLLFVMDILLCQSEQPIPHNMCRENNS